MLYINAKCDQCKEGLLPLEFEKREETISDLLAAINVKGWRASILPGLTEHNGLNYEIVCNNCLTDHKKSA